MGEDSSFVRSANPGYSVGQTVTDPVIMENVSHEVRRRSRIVMSLAAAAACLAITCGVGYHYYSVNYKTHSTVIISSNAGVKMYLNKKDKVIRLESISPEGESILSTYSGKGKYMADAINDIVGIGISKGYITGGDTVEVYVPDNEGDSSRKEIEDDLAGMSVKADVQPIEKYDASKKNPAPQPPEVSEPPAPPDIDVPGPPNNEGIEVPDVPEPPSVPEDHPQPPEPPSDREIIKPDPPEVNIPPEKVTLPAEHEKKLPDEPKTPRHDSVPAPHAEASLVPEQPAPAALEVLHISSLKKLP